MLNNRNNFSLDNIRRESLKSYKTEITSRTLDNICPAFLFCVTLVYCPNLKINVGRGDYTFVPEIQFGHYNLS